MSTVIKHVNFLGDSLSDEGDLDHRKLFGVIPMAALSGLDESPIGRFTNGFTWADDFTIRQIENFVIDIICQEWDEQKLRDLGFDPTKKIGQLLLHQDYKRANTREEVAEAFSKITQDEHENSLLFNFLNKCFTLTDYRYVRFLGTDFVRNYAQGGLTAHNWKNSLTDLEICHPIASAQAFGARETVENLSAAREKLFRYDRKNGVDAKQKSETLIFEWSGANDLITVNVEPLEDAANKAVDARIDNLKHMIANGYRHFVLIDLPNLSLTPRYQNELLEAQKSGDQARIAAANQKLKNIAAICEGFNQKLRADIATLKAELSTSDPTLASQLNIDVFDAYGAFQDIYDNAAEEGFTELTTPFVDSKDYNNKDVDSSVARKYMFWNDVHPSAHMHEILAQKAQEFVQSKYKIESPATFKAESFAIQAFLERYDVSYMKAKGTFFGKFRNSQLSRDNLTLEGIFEHALRSGPTRNPDSIIKHRGDRTLSILRTMQWVTPDGQLGDDIKDNPVFRSAYDQAMHNIEPKEHTNAMVQATSC
jgi:phospholipase/lecithinase/hemolysin